MILEFETLDHFNECVRVCTIDALEELGKQNALSMPKECDQNMDITGAVSKVIARQLRKQAKVGQDGHC